jgi:phosphoglycolate phosphatase
MQERPLIIWDFDGTMADSLGVVERLLLKLAPDYGIAAPDRATILDWRGKDLKTVLVHLGLSWRKVPGLLLKVQRGMAKEIAGIPVIAGLEPVMRELAKDYRFVLLSSNAKDNVERWLDMQGWRGWFERVVTGSSLGGKARHFDKLVKQMKVPKHRVVVVGDEFRDIAAARESGLKCVIVGWGFQTEAGLRQHGVVPVVKPEELRTAIGAVLAGAA